jgi:NAD(P)H-quinone oxidoreductase subunit 5
MNELVLPTLLLIGLPAALMLAFAVAWLVGHVPGERVLARSSLAMHVVLVALVAWLVFQFVDSGAPALKVDVGSWFAFQEVEIHFAFLLDRLSLTMAALTVVLVGLVSAFSVRYMHRDPGHLRFFLLMQLFTFGALILFLASSLDLLFGGWELVGLSSVLLVGFFQYRREPLRNALKVFAAYRLADLQIVLATVFAHLWLGGAGWENMLSGVAQGHVEAPAAAYSILAVLVIIGACGKSAQGPFFGWLARAMEGPTPSSAIFYGAISVHAGAYLLLRIQPLIADSPVATGTLIAIGAITAIVSTIVQRTRPDAKTSLAYAVQSQLGLIMVEIALGWTTLALLHIVGHALLRTMQFLRAPSLLHDHHTMHAAAGGHLIAADPAFRRLPEALRIGLYRFGMSQGHYDAFVHRLAERPVHQMARSLGSTSPRAVIFMGAMLIGTCVIGMQGHSEPMGSVAWTMRMMSVIFCVCALLAGVRAFAERRPRRVVNLVLISVASMALAGFASLEPKGVVGGVLVAIMFVIAGSGIRFVLRALETRTHLVEDPHEHLGLGQKAPRLSFFFLVFGLALVGIPGTLGFVAEDLLFHGALHVLPIIGIALPLATALNAIHLLRTWHLVFNGRLPKDVASIPDALPREYWPLLIAMLLLVAQGLAPQMIIDLATPATERIIHLSDRTNHQ